MSERRAAPTVGQVVLGRRLQELREAAGLRREEAAQVLRVAPATVRRMEMAEVTLKIPYVQVLLTTYGVPEPGPSACAGGATRPSPVKESRRTAADTRRLLGRVLTRKASLAGVR